MGQTLSTDTEDLIVPVSMMSFRVMIRCISRWTASAAALA